MRNPYSNRIVRTCRMPMTDTYVLLRLPTPAGWIALTRAELCSAQRRALELFPAVGAHDARRDASRPAERRALLTPSEAAHVLAVDPSWLLRRAREGAIECVRLGKYVRFDAETIIGQCTKRPVSDG